MPGTLKSTAEELLDTHPRLREQMHRSERFAALAARHRIEIDGRALYIYRGDALGDLEDLYVDTLVRGAAGSEEAARPLYEELDDELKQVITKRLKRSP